MLNLGSKFRLTAMALSTIGLCCPAVSSADPGTLQFNSSNYFIDEAGSDIGPYGGFTVKRTGGTDGEVTVNFRTSDGTATAGDDYVSKTGTLIWRDGEEIAEDLLDPDNGNNALIEILEDSVNEADEIISIELFGETGGATLGDRKTATLTIIGGGCGPGVDWVKNCPEGTDVMTNTVGNMEVEIYGIDETFLVKTHGPTQVHREEAVDQSIDTEIVSMQLKGKGHGIVVRAGTDWELAPSNGEITQASGDTKADSFFDIFFEIDASSLGLGKLSNNTPMRVEQRIDRVPPLGYDYYNGTQIPILLYDITDQEIGVIRHLIHSVKFVRISRAAKSVTLDSFTAKAKNGSVKLKWKTGTEKDNAGFVVWRGQPVNGTCSNDQNKYTDVQPITPLVDSQGTEVSGATYNVTDSNVVSGNTYCYALQDIEYDGGDSTFHMDDIVSATP